MKQLVSVNLTTRTAKDWVPPVLTFGESLTLALRLYKNSAGSEIEAGLTINSLKASIGIVDARPRGGQCALKIGTDPQSSTNTTAALEFNVAASKLKERINAVDAAAAYGAARVVWSDGSWLIFFGDQTEQVPMTVVDNGMWPVSIGRVTAWQASGKWVHELRFTQAPVAFTSSHDIVLPPSPEVTRIQAGGTDGTEEWNEIQQLYVPAEFRGAYTLKRGFTKTTLLSREDGIDTIQEAMQALGADCWKVTLPVSDKPTIEFIGDYAGQSQELLVTTVEQAPPGDLAFTLVLDRAELAAALRRAGEAVTLPLEIRVIGTDENGFTGEQLALTLDVMIQPPLIWPDMEEVPLLDLLRPYSPKTYVPYGAGNELVGQKYYRAVVGDGVLEEFVIATGLNSETVYVFGRENISGGRQLIDGTDFSVTIDDDNQVTVTALTGAPAEDAWVFVIFSAQTLAQWAADLTVTVPQVVAGGGYPSLPSYMDSTSVRLEALEAILPSIGAPATSSQDSGVVIELPDTKEVLFSKKTAEELKSAWDADGLDATKIGRATMIFPAVHDASLTSYAAGDLPALAVGSVWTNDTAGVLDMGRGIYGGKVAVGGFFASDGRARYAVTRDGATNSYYPTGFHRELWRIFVNEKMLRINRTLDVQFGIALQLANATSNAQWILVIEKGTAPSQSTPSVTGTNLENVVWDTTAILSQRLIITGNRQTHSFGARIKRELVSLVDTIKLDTMLYGVWEGNDAAAPATANFALRARLINFDTENALATDAKGSVVYEIIGASSEGASKPKAVLS
jgi:hypothetical protein